MAYLRTLRIDEALARTDATETVHYLADALGSSVALTTASGTLATSYTYEPFGRTEVSGAPSANGFHFTGRENDGTGLYYYRARYYDSTRSRFISQDPIGFRGGPNAYAYAADSPLNYRDPRGWEATACSDCPSGVWSGVGGNVGGMLVSAGVFTGVYRVTCWDNGKSCWIMVRCAGTGGGLGGSLSGESAWASGARSSRDLAGRTEGTVVFGGKGVVGVGGSWGQGGSTGNAVTGPIPNPSSSSSGTLGAGIGLGGGYLIGACDTTLLSCN